MLPVTIATGVNAYYVETEHMSHGPPPFIPYDHLMEQVNYSGDLLMEQVNYTGDLLMEQVNYTGYNLMKQLMGGGEVHFHFFVVS